MHKKTVTTSEIFNIFDQIGLRSDSIGLLVTRLGRKRVNICVSLIFCTITDDRRLEIC